GVGDVGGCGQEAAAVWRAGEEDRGAGLGTVDRGGGGGIGAECAGYGVAVAALFGAPAVGQVYDAVEFVCDRGAEAPGVLRGGLGVVGRVCGDCGAVSG